MGQRGKQRNDHTKPDDEREGRGVVDPRFIVFIVAQSSGCKDES